MTADWPVAETRLVDYAARDDEGRTDVFVQWKGTDVCFDFHCECGQDAHFDGYFAYQWACKGCGAIWVMPNTVYPVKVDAPTGSAMLRDDDEGWDWELFDSVSQ